MTDTKGWTLPDHIARTYKEALAAREPSPAPADPRFTVTQEDLKRFRARQAAGETLFQLPSTLAAAKQG